MSFCKRCCCALAKEWYEKNLERARANERNRVFEGRAKLACAKYNEKNHAKVLAMGRDWYRRNRISKMAKVKEWLRLHPKVERARRVARSHRQRAYRLGVSSANGRSRDIFRLWWFQSGCCQYCSRKMSWETMTLDHMIPLSRGGNNHSSNWALACSFCNGSKRNRTMEEFYEATR